MTQSGTPAEHTCHWHVALLIIPSVLSCCGLLLQELRRRFESTRFKELTYGEFDLDFFFGMQAPRLQRKQHAVGHSVPSIRTTIP